MLFDHLLQRIPDFRTHPLNHSLCGFDIARRAVIYQRLHYEWLEQLERHFLWKTTLMKLQLRTNNDNRTSRVVNTLSEQVLAEATFLTLKHVRKRLESTTIGARNRTLTTSVIDKSIHSFLQQSLFVVDD